MQLWKLLLEFTVIRIFRYFNNRNIQIYRTILLITEYPSNVPFSERNGIKSINSFFYGMRNFPLEEVACRRKPSQSAPITSPFPLYRKGGFIRARETAADGKASGNVKARRWRFNFINLPRRSHLLRRSYAAKRATKAIWIAFSGIDFAGDKLSLSRARDIRILRNMKERAYLPAICDYEMR